MPLLAEHQKAATEFPKLAELITYLDSLKGRADLKTLEKILARINITRDDILPACVFGVKGYRRNTICKSEHYELLANCWHSGHCTPIHDHKGVSCAFKIIEGIGTEIRFEVTPSKLICPVSTVTMQPGYVCAADEADIHEVANMQAADQDLITLHIYSPPISKMNVYAYGEASTAECGDCYEKC